MKFLLVFCFLANAMVVKGEPTPTEMYTHSATLRTGNIKVYWMFDETHITFEVHGNTLGWIGIGLSSNGAMTGADIFVGWVENDDVRVTDRHGVGNTFPPLDPKQDIKVLGGTESDGWTMFKFSRQLAACEEDYDREITRSTQRLIYAWGDEDPNGDDITSSNYHGTNKGVESMLFLEPPSAQRDLPTGPTYHTFDILADNFLIPAEDTYYNCKLFKLPTLTKKHHVVKFEPVIQEGNEVNVHHMIVYRCGDLLQNETELGVDARCYSPNMQHFESCTTYVASWAIGGGAVIYPDIAGLSIGNEGDPIYVQLETHYDNPSVRSDIVDSSGFRFTYTDTLREFDSGTVEVGVLVLGTEHLIPPGAESFLSVGYCTQRCIENRMEDAGVENITVFGVALHSHLAGKALRLRHVRDGVELKHLASDETYDFNYQESRYFDPPIILQKNDHLIMECVYNTEERTVMTTAGLGTQDEMCQGFLEYYPKIDWASCSSSVSYQWTWPHLGVDPSKVEQIPDTDQLQVSSYKLTGPPELAGKNLLDFMNELDWSTEELRDEFADFYNSVPHYDYCLPQNRSAATYEAFNITEITSPYVPVRKECIESTTAPETTPPALETTPPAATEPSTGSTTSHAVATGASFACLLVQFFACFIVTT